MKKKAKQIAKRETFWGIFMKRTGMGIIVVLLVYGISVLLLYEYQKVQFPEVIGNDLDYDKRVMESIIGEKQSLEQAERRRLTAHLVYSGTYWEADAVDSYIVIKDNATGENVADSYRRGIWVFDRPDDDEEGKTYYCETEDVELYYPYFKTWNEYETPFYQLFGDIIPFYFWLGYDTDVRIQSAYIKDKDFIPGKVEVTTYHYDAWWDPEKTSVVNREVIEYRKECPPGYETVDLSELSYSGTNLFMVQGGTMKEQDVPIPLEKKEIYRQSDLRFVYSRYDVLTDASGHSYTMYGYFRLKNNFFITNRILLILIFIAYMVVMLFIVWLTATLTNSRNKAFYMMDDYRRNLINSLAHDLKSPLMSMSGCAENLKVNVHTQKREHYVDMIAQNVTYMNHIIDETLELSRLDACVTNGEKAEVDLCRLAREVVEKYEPLAERKKLYISVEGGYIVHANEDEMRSIMDNLISNAVKYTKESGTVLVSGTEKEFVIGNDTEEELPQDIEKLWEAFVKGDESRTNRTGSGLGLAIVKACLERNRLHGNICFEEGRFVVKIN